MRKLDLSGCTFGDLTVLPEWEKRPRGIWWKARCACGKEKFFFIGNLRKGASKSCGCKRGEGGKNWTTHGLSKHPLHKVWKGMRARCFSKTNQAYPAYGGRGITICDRWSEFSNFYEDMSHSWEAGLWLERINVDGNYEPQNCRWETPREQARNKRRTVRIITPDGEILLSDAARKYGIRHPTLWHRWKIGKRGKDLIAAPKRTGYNRPICLVRVPTEQLIAELTTRGFQMEQVPNCASP